jgi:hypothetical protein
VQLFGYLGTLSFVGIIPLNWIEHVNGMDAARKVGQVFNNNPQGSQLIGPPKTMAEFCLNSIDKYKLTICKERSRNRADMEESTTETKVCIGLKSFCRRRRNRGRRRRKRKKRNVRECFSIRLGSLFERLPPPKKNLFLFIDSLHSCTFFTILH